MKGYFKALNNCSYIKFTPYYFGKASIADLKMQKHFSNFIFTTKRYKYSRSRKFRATIYQTHMSVAYYGTFYFYFGFASSLNSFISEYKSFLEY